MQIALGIILAPTLCVMIFWRARHNPFVQMLFSQAFATFFVLMTVVMAIANNPWAVIMAFVSGFTVALAVVTTYRMKLLDAGLLTDLKSSLPSQEPAKAP